MTQPIIAAIDIDETLCDTSGIRDDLPSNPWGCYQEWEASIQQVDFDLVRGASKGVDALIGVNATIVLVTSRSTSLRACTEVWIEERLNDLYLHGYGMMMRPLGDFRAPKSLRLDQLAELQKGLGLDVQNGLDAEIWYIDDFPVQTLLRTFKAPEDWPIVVALCKGEV